jgi:hypothetical protein
MKEGYIAKDYKWTVSEEKGVGEGTNGNGGGGEGYAGDVTIWFGVLEFGEVDGDVKRVRSEQGSFDRWWDCQSLQYQYWEIGERERKSRTEVEAVLAHVRSWEFGQPRKKVERSESEGQCGDFEIFPCCVGLVEMLRGDVGDGFWAEGRGRWEVIEWGES